MQRYFANIYSGEVALSKDDAFHLEKVMRARAKDKIEVVSDEKVYLCEVASLKPLSVKVKSTIEENNELRCHVILVAALLKGDHTDLIVQKATELGASEIVLLSTERTIVKIKDKEREHKLNRYRLIAKEAAEQSKRLIIPTVRFLKFSELDEINAKLKLIAYEGMQGLVDKYASTIEKIKSKESIAILIGPEGGFSKGEVDTACYYGYKKISLGKRILRAETACFYALSVISNILEKK